MGRPDPRPGGTDRDAAPADPSRHARAGEVCHLLARAGHQRASEDFLLDIADGFYDLVNPVAPDYTAARDLIARHRGTLRRRGPKPDVWDLAHAMNAVVAARQETTLIATLDQDHRVIHPLGGPPYFTLRPDDLQPGSTDPSRRERHQAGVAARRRREGRLDACRASSTPPTRPLGDAQ